MEARSRNLGYGFPGYDGCFPKATRSSRGRSDHTMRKSIEANDLPKDMCFFELLATVAGQLLQEQDGEALAARSLVDLEAPKVNAASVIDNSTACSIHACHTNGPETAILPMQEEVMKATKVPKHLRCMSDKRHEPHMANFSLHDNSDPLHGQKQVLKPVEESIKAYSSRKQKTSGAISCQGSAMVTSSYRHVKKETGQRITPRSVQCTSKAKIDFPQEMVTASSMDLKDTTQEDDVDQLCSSHEIAPFQNIESPLLVSSGSSEETPFQFESKSYSTVAFESNRQGDVVDDFSRWKAGDDDDNSSESTVPKSLLTKSSSMSYTQARKARRCTKSTARRRSSGSGSKRKSQEMEDGEKSQNEKSRLGKNNVSKSQLLKDDIEQSNNSPVGMVIHTEPIDKLDGSPIRCEREKSSSVMSSPIASSPTKQLDDSNVKLSIKSFMVPELMVALPESATVANLKKAVMEAAMSLLGGGLCVRVLLQGKKVADETESLLDAGISSGGKLDSLGFMLEPNPFPTSAGIEDTFLVLSHNANQTSSRYPVLSKGSEFNTGSYHVGNSEGLPEIDANSSGTEMQSTTVSPSKEDGLVNDSNGLVGSCALVLHSNQANNSPNGLAVVPFGQSSGSVGMNKRRIRRPFSVAEVEVLVQAVEKLGTGRWRDVKLHAFPQAKHRTYVDLKDKWKTLVHTASIAPHQRRGEPVPQGLLDRVIQAHSYWTAQQAKQQSMETKVF